MPDLREVVVGELLAPKGVQADRDNILITNGGLEGMNLLCQLFIEGNGMGNNCMRISFGAVPPEKIKIGAERLGRLICSKIENGLSCPAE